MGLETDSAYAAGAQSINGTSSQPGNPLELNGTPPDASHYIPDQKSTMPIAVIGLSCRFPGGSDNPSKLWSMLKNGQDGWSEAPKDRFDMRSFYHPETSTTGTFNATGGHFIKGDVSKFDAPFFNISPLEAKAMDPQQRFNLETAYEAAENAGILIEDLVGSDTSVYYGVFNGDYGRMICRDPDNFPFYQATGSGVAVLANRLSYFFDLRGPSMVLDTGCSGSLVALHLACQSLRSGESKMSIVGGTNLMIDPQVMLGMSTLKFFSEQGRCFTFDERGIGYGRGEGVAAVILKPLATAIRDRDPIRAIIRNTASNSDGKTPGLTLPSAEAQEALIRRAYSEAGLRFNDTMYFEAHGTGTSAGDPIEAEAIGKTFGEGRTTESPIIVGSVKTNIGHLESSSGIAGFIKTVLLLENGIIPPSLNYNSSNPEIPMEKWHIKVPTECIPWPENKIRRASVNSFGYGGCSAHAIVDAATSIPEETRMSESRPDSTDWEKVSHNRSGASVAQPIIKENGALPSPPNSEDLNGETILNGDKQRFSGEESFLNGKKEALNGERGFFHGDQGVVNEEKKIPDEASEVPNGKVKFSNGEMEFCNGAAASLNGEIQTHNTEKETVNGGSAVLKPAIHHQVNGDGIESPKTSKTDRLFILSAKAERPVKRMAMFLRTYLSEKALANEEILLSDLAYTLGSRRSKFNARIALHASSVMELMCKLDGRISKPTTTSTTQPIGYVFTGQGAQWFAMGRELGPRYPVFARSLERADEYFKELGADWSLRDELNKSESESRLGAAFLSQPVCTALQLALIDLLKSWNISPSRVVGHSSGEIAAAYASDALSAEDALRVAYFRGYCVNSLRNSSKFRPGAMMAVGTSAEATEPYIEKVTSGNVCVACINSPESVTVSGDESAIEDLRQCLEEGKVWCRKLNVDTAYHSHHMVAIANDYEATIKDIQPHPTREGVQFYSSVSGEKIGGLELGPAYWVRNLTSQVKFSQALINMCATSESASSGESQQIGTIVEVGPHSALAGPVKQSIATIKPALGIQYFSALDRKKDGIESILDMVAGLICRGQNVDVSSINSIASSRKPRVLTDMPTYPWNHSTSYWFESRLSSEYRKRAHPRHHLLGVSDSDYNDIEPSWRHIVRIAENPWLKGHVIQGNIVYPAAAYICAVIQACFQHNERFPDRLPISGYNFRDVAIGKALLLTEGAEGVETKLVLRPFNTSAKASSLQWNEFRIFSYAEASGWMEHCRGLIEVQHQTSETPAEDYNHGLHGSAANEFKRASIICRTGVLPLQLYEDLEEAGFQYSGTFRSISSARCGDEEALCEVIIPDTAETMPHKYELPHTLHPATLDGCLQTLFPALMSNGVLNNVMVPTSIKKIFVSSSISSTPGEHLRVLSKANRSGSQGCEALLTVLPNESSSPVIEISGLKCSRLSSAPNTKEERRISHNIQWILDPDHVSAEELEEMVQKDVYHKSAKARIALFDDVVDAIICETLRSLGDPQNFSIPNTHHQNLYRWMREYAEGLQHEPLSAELAEDITAESPSGKLVCHVGAQLPGIIRGEVDPLALMMENDLLYSVYSDDLQDRCYAQMANYLILLAKKNPDLTILEIGGGTGGATFPLLEALGSGREALFSQWDFTDISTGFFEKAQVKFEKWGGRIKYKKLDIEKPPGAQGFKEGSYDIIVAANVLHATTSISNTLENVQSLLKPGGQLMLMEILRLSTYLNITFGTLPGWWLGVDDGRKDSPLLTQSGWDDALKNAGFSGVDFSMHDQIELDNRRMGVLVATAVGEEEETGPKSVEVVVPADMMDQEDHPLMTSLKEKLELEGYTVEFKSLETANPVEKICSICLDMFGSSFDQMSEDAFLKVRKLILDAAEVLWITQGACHDVSNPDSATITGFLRTARAEYPELSFVSLDLDTNTTFPQAAQNITKVIKTTFKSRKGQRSPDKEMVERNGHIFVPRMIENAEIDVRIQALHQTVRGQDAPFHQPDRHLRLHVDTPGLLDTLIWTDDEKDPLPPDQIEIETKASGVNFRDVMVSLGQLESSTQMGGECSGVVIAVGADLEGRFKVGDRVCGWGLGSYASYARMVGLSAQILPDDLSFELAASIPIVFSTAYYSLVTLARLQSAETILIHSAMGGVGQAAVMIAQHIGAEIYVTVGSADKRRRIKDKFGIPDDHIFSSRGISFADQVLHRTGGKGVSVVLNSLAGEGLRASLDCLGMFGRFIEIGKRDILTNYRLDMEAFDRNITFSSVDFTKICAYQMPLLGQIMDSVFKLFRDKALKPVEPIITYPMNDIEAAFRLLQSGKHIGKVIMTTENVNVKATAPQGKKTRFSSDGSYIIAGGLGGLGRIMCEWMASRGARSIIVLSRSGLKNDEVDTAWKAKLESQGVQFNSLQCDVSDKDQVDRIVAHCDRELPPVKGIIQAAMVLKDSMVETMSYETLQVTLPPKVIGTKNLHNAFIKHDLEFFVMLSSASGIIGNQGQANYGAACTFQDAFARYRHSLGLPACSIDLGMVQSAGYVAQNPDVIEFLSRRGMSTIKLSEFLATLDYSCSLPAGPVDQSQIILGISPPQGEANQGILADPKFVYLRRSASGEDGAGTVGAREDIAKMIKAAESWAECVEIVLEEISAKLSTMLAIPREDIQPTDSIFAMGADSLVAVELRNWLAANMEASVQVLEILNPILLKQFAEFVATKSALVTKKPA